MIVGSYVPNKTSWRLEATTRDGQCVYRKWCHSAAHMEMFKLIPDTTTGITFKVHPANRDDEGLNAICLTKVQSYVSREMGKLQGENSPAENANRNAQARLWKRVTPDRKGYIPPRVHHDVDYGQLEGELQPVHENTSATLVAAKSTKDDEILGLTKPRPGRPRKNG